MFEMSFLKPVHISALIRIKLYLIPALSSPYDNTILIGYVRSEWRVAFLKTSRCLTEKQSIYTIIL